MCVVEFVILGRCLRRANQGESWEEVTTLGQLTEEQNIYLRSLVRSFLAISKYPVLRSSCPWLHLHNVNVL